MTDWDTAAEDWARAGPAGSPPATWGEIIAANVREGGLGTFFGVESYRKDAYRALEERLYAETGQTGVQFTDRWGGRQSGEPIPLADRAYLIGQNLGKLDKGQREAIAPLVDIDGRAHEAAAEASADDAAIAARTYGVGGNAVAWAAYLTRQALDPVNLAAGLATAGAGAGAATTIGAIGRIAAEGALASAIVAPTVIAAREAAGLPNEPYFTQVAEGALFNLGFAGAVHGIAGLLRGGAAVGRYLRGRRIEPPIDPADQLAVADAIETRELLADQAHPPTPAERARMPARIDRAGEALEGRRINDEPVAGGGADPSLAGVRDIERQVAAGGAEKGAPTAAPTLGPHEIVVGGRRYGVTYKVRELADITVSHKLDGTPNPNYPAAAQPRDLSTPASRSLVADAAAHYRPDEALDQSQSPQIGPPVVTPSLVTMIGNRRTQMLARVYDRHPEHADAYRAGLIARGYDIAGMQYPVLVRELGEELTPEEMRFFGRAGNVSATGRMSATERAFSDAGELDAEIMSLHRSGPISSLANVPFVQAFVGRLRSATEREAIVSKENVLSIEGAREIEAALVAKAYEAPDIVAGLFEEIAPTSRAILGALADNAGKAARVKAEIAAGRIAPELDPSPALVDAFRLVERARRTGQKVADLIAQVDLEFGAVSPHVVDAVNRYFRDPPGSAAAIEAGAAYRVAAGRQAISPQIELAMDTALARANAAGDLLGFKPDAGFALREGGTAEMPPGDLAVSEELDAAVEPPPEPTPSEPALAGMILPPEPVYAPPPAGTPAEAAALLEKARTPGPGSVTEFLARRAGADELGAHPDVVASNAYASGLTPTSKLPGFGSPRFFRERVYKFGDRLVTGANAAIDELVKVAKAYSPGGVRNAREAVLVIGPPAAGKSTIAEALAKELHAAIPDPDDAKKAIDGFRGGIGANAVHLESSVLTGEPGGVIDRLAAEGANLVIPKVGEDAASLEKFILDLKGRGYSVKLMSLFVEPDEAYRRMINRYLRSGRIINDAYFKAIGAKPSEAYYILVGKEGLLDGGIEIDGSGPAGGPRNVRHTSGSGVGARPGGKPGSDRGLVSRPTGGKLEGGRGGEEGAARRVPEAGGRRDLTASEAGYTAQALANLKKTSRTAAGVIDTSSTAGKAEKMVADLTPEQAAARATANFTAVIGDIYRVRNALPTDAAGVLELVDRTAARVNEGIVKPGELDRSLDTNIASQTRVADLPAAKRQFAEELAARFADPAADPVETAAWIEWRANVIDHFWSDGTGKTSRALAAAPLMRAGLPLPDYPVNKVTYSYAPARPVDPAAGGAGYLGGDWHRWNYFYHELMPETPAAKPAKPIGDPQLEAEAQGVVDQVGESYLIKLAEPDSEEVRTLSIAEARAEIEAADAAADELLACIAGGAAVAAAGAAAAGAAAP